MIATRSHRRSTSSRSCEDSRIGRAACALLGDDLVELLLHERIQAARRLVEDEQLGRMEERLDEADLLAVAAREVPDRTIEVRARSARRARPSGQGPRMPRSAAKNVTSSRPVRRGSHANSPGRLPSRARIARLSRRLSRPNSRALPLVGCRRSSSVRIIVVLPAPLGPRKPNTSPRATDSEIVVDPALVAVALGQAIGLDDGARRRRRLRRDGRGDGRQEAHLSRRRCG